MVCWSDISDIPEVISALPDVGLPPGGHFPITHGIQMENTVENSEHMESSTLGDSNKGSRLEAPKNGATGRDSAEQEAGDTPLIGEHPTTSNPSPENMEGLTEKVGTLGLRATSKNNVVLPRSGRARPGSRRLLRGTLAAANPGLLMATSHILNLDHLGSSGATPQSGGHPTGPSKRQGSAGGTPEGGQAKRPKQGGQLSYVRVAREGLHVAVVCEDYPESQISKENFTAIQREIGRLVDELPEEGLNPRLVDSY